MQPGRLQGGRERPMTTDTTTPTAKRSTGTCPWKPCLSATCAEFGDELCRLGAEEDVNNAVDDARAERDERVAGWPL